MKKLLAFCLLGCIPLAAQQREIPVASQLPGRPFFIKNTWLIGGVGNWDYLTMDPAAHRLFIAHGTKVQVVDVDSGSLVGEITGFREAHSIALDDTGGFGYVSDGRANKVTVFDRRSLRIAASIPTVPNPRALVFEPQSKLLFVVRTDPPAETPTPPGRRNTRPGVPGAPSANLLPMSGIAVIDTETQTALGEILLSGKLGFAQADGMGDIYVIGTDRNQVLRLDAEAVAHLFDKEPGGVSSPSPQTSPAEADGSFIPAVIFNWSGISISNSPATNPPDGALHAFGLPQECKQPKGLAIDGPHLRLFAACDNMKIVVLNTGTGQPIASLTTGLGTDAIGYDQSRGLIYVANGGGYGSLTIIQQDATTDTYAVIQNLPTRERARTLAVDPSTGEVYLVTDFQGVDLTHPGGIGTLKTAPVDGSFQVLAIGH